MIEHRWLLAIDTSTDWAGIALTDGRDWAELNWSSGRRQTTQLLPEIDRLLGRMDMTVQEVGAIAVAIGPGSFSGLRVGLSLAKGFALAADLPIIGVSTLEATMVGWLDGERPLVGVVRAGRKRFVWAEHGLIDDVRSGETSLLVASVPEGARVVGELDDEVAVELAAKGCIVQDEPLRRRRASAVAVIGWRRWRTGDVDDSAALEPVYIHRS